MRLCTAQCDCRMCMCILGRCVISYLCIHASSSSGASFDGRRSGRVGGFLEKAPRLSGNIVSDVESASGCPLVGCWTGGTTRTIVKKDGDEKAAKTGSKKLEEGETPEILLSVLETAGGC